MFIESRSFSIHYEIEGSGTPLLLIHGAPMWGDLWRERGYLDLLKDRFRVITIDVLGHGQSDKPSDPTAYGFVNAAGTVWQSSTPLGPSGLTYGATQWGPGWPRR